MYTRFRKHDQQQLQVRKLVYSEELEYSLGDLCTLWRTIEICIDIHDQSANQESGACIVI